jgi:hypothetical protein
VIYSSLPCPYLNIKNPIRNATAEPAPMGTNKNIGDATNLERTPIAGLTASTTALSNAPSIAPISPNVLKVSAPSPPSAKNNDCKSGNAFSCDELLVFCISNDENLFCNPPFNAILFNDFNANALLRHPQHAIITKIATESLCVEVFIVEDQSQSGFHKLLSFGR